MSSRKKWLLVVVPPPPSKKETQVLKHAVKQIVSKTGAAGSWQILVCLTAWFIAQEHGSKSVHPFCLVKFSTCQLQRRTARRVSPSGHATRATLKALPPEAAASRDPSGSPEWDGGILARKIPQESTPSKKSAETARFF